jgi:thiol:disulfide interchange protein
VLWCLGAAAVLIACLEYYVVTRPIEWTPYSKQALDENLEAGRPVLINFHADWDVASRVNDLAFESTEQSWKLRWKLRWTGVKCLEADYTNQSEEIRSALEAIDQISIPVIAIYFPEAPNDPAVLEGGVSPQHVVKALDERR